MHREELQLQREMAQKLKNSEALTVSRLTDKLDNSAKELQDRAGSGMEQQARSLAQDAVKEFSHSAQAETNLIANDIDERAQRVANHAAGTSPPAGSAGAGTAGAG